MRRHAGVGRFGPALLLALLLSATLAATLVARARVNDRERAELSDGAQSTASAIQRRIETYAQVLRGIAGLYESSDHVTPDDFHRYVDSQQLGRRYPGLSGVLHATVVTPAEIPSFERATRRALAASRLPYPRTYVVHPTTGPARRQLLVVDRLDPATPEAVSMGLDLLTDPYRGPTAQLAGRRGQPVASMPLRLFRQRGSSLGVVLVVPTADPATGAFDGVVYAAFQMDQLLRGALGRLERGVRLELFDVGRGGTAPALTKIPAQATAFDLRAGAVPRRDDDHTRIETIEVAGRRWALSYVQPSTSLGANERAVPWIIAVSGILVSLLAAALLRALTTSEARAVRLAERMTVELREREAELERSNEELEHFAYLASHDLQEPLRTITSYVGLLDARAGGHLEERERTWLRFVTEGAERMSRLIADLLEYSRTGRAYDGDRAEPVALNDAWDVAVANLDGAIADAGATVTRDELPVVDGRIRELTSLLQNIIGNGLKYRGDAAPEIRASARAVDGRWEIAVSDNGIGIDPRFHDRVFGLFQRLHTADEYPGTGMGLAIVKKIAESNGGTVRVESTPGEGATFVLELPRTDETR